MTDETLHIGQVVSDKTLPTGQVVSDETLTIGQEVSDQTLYACLYHIYPQKDRMNLF